MIPCCFHPTRVVIIHDCQELISTLENRLSKSHILDIFRDPSKALHYINDVYQPEPFYNRYKRTTEDKRHKKPTFKTHNVDTYHEIYRSQRFEEISTVVIEYSPLLGAPSKMNGLEFFNQLKNQHIQKILLIGESDFEIVNAAMNNGLIHDFICKEDLSWDENFYDKVHDAQWRYFNKLTEIYLENIRPGNVQEFAFNDPTFQRFFKTIVHNYGFTEAYLCETTGSYLFLDDQAQDHGLIVKIADQLDNWVRTGQAKGIKSPLLKELKNRKKMICYHSQNEGVEPDKSHWEIYAHPLKTIKGQSSTYYYAFAPNMHDIDLERILPFEEYRENQQRKASRIH